MSTLFEELDYQRTPMGALSLRRRSDAAFGSDVYEVKLGDDFLMSSRYTAAEEALAELTLAEHSGGDVVVGGLGLGYTAAAVLNAPEVHSLHVIEALPPVIDWHRRGLLPLGARLTGDVRCRLVSGDFFRLAATAGGFDPETPGRRFDAILVDIDHSPRNLLEPRNAAFYTPEGVEQLTHHLNAGGVFGLWSNDPPEDAFCAALEQVFTAVRTETVAFPTPTPEGVSSNTIYIATMRPTDDGGHGR